MIGRAHEGRRPPDPDADRGGFTVSPFSPPLPGAIGWTITSLYGYLPKGR
jgi:hypothetical protein